MPMQFKNNHYYLMRHGESLANRRGLIVSAPENAMHNYGLTTKGAEQVLQTALNTRLDRSTIIVSSDFQRAAETADIVHSVIDCENDIIAEQRLRERSFGDWELQDYKHYESIWAQDQSNPTQMKGNVETVQHTLERALSAIEDLETQYIDKNILLVSHGDVLQILLAHYHNINTRFHRSLSGIRNADIRSLAKLELSNRAPAA